MIHVPVAVVLETMWGGSGEAPGWFRINPSNHSGRRLIWLTGVNPIWVTDSCREYVEKATQHGSPDPEWLAYNLQRLSYDLLILGGRVAQRTF